MTTLSAAGPGSLRAALEAEKGEHSKGSLIHDNTSGVLLYRNVHASNRERNALFSRIRV